MHTCLLLGCPVLGQEAVKSGTGRCLTRGLPQSPEVQVVLDRVRLGKIVFRVVFGRSSAESRFVYGEFGGGNGGGGLGSVRRLFFIAAAKIIKPTCVYLNPTVKSKPSLLQLRI